MRDPRYEVGQAMHTLRDGWKLWCWDQFLNGNRHESPQLAQTTAPELLRVDFGKLRKTIESDAAARSVATLAAVSPAWFKDRAHIRSPQCIWCSELGSWEHLCWSCEHSPLISHRPPFPSSPLIRRLGWTSGDQTVLLYMSHVQKALWQAHYGENWTDVFLSLWVLNILNVTLWKPKCICITQGS